MKSYLYFICFFVTITYTVSCGPKNQIKKELKDFYNSRIELPLDSMVNFSSKEINAIHKQTEYTYIIYIDSMSCSNCAISHLSDWSQLNLIGKKNRNRLKYMLIIAPKRNQYMNISETIQKGIFVKDVILFDTVGVFERSNPYLPTNKLLHTFLIDKNSKVILIGSPINNPKIKNMLIKLLN